ncbi:hypothetical protein KDK_26820 [Dictyobacter kobayashii]|uniref:Uncharacterized protein n=2 Tax=Dictyobacter kobayashii TaxID=2014872 RepID=A0A402AID3_9CHLR|nr:hypothetical protein KDK_26820 [Dictyobacter kobayashii]
MGFEYKGSAPDPNRQNKPSPDMNISKQKDNGQQSRLKANLSADELEHYEEPQYREHVSGPLKFPEAAPRAPQQPVQPPYVPQMPARTVYYPPQNQQPGYGQPYPPQNQQPGYGQPYPAQPQRPYPAYGYPPYQGQPAGNNGWAPPYPMGQPAYNYAPQGYYQPYNGYYNPYGYPPFTWQPPNPNGTLINL